AAMRTPAGEPAERAGRHHVAGVVVLLAAGAVGQHVVRLGYRLELLLGLLVAGILVGMEVAGERAVGLLDLRRRGSLRHTPLVVLVLLGVVPFAHVSTSFPSSRLLLRGGIAVGGGCFSGALTAGRRVTIARPAGPRTSAGPRTTT